MSMESAIISERRYVEVVDCGRIGWPEYDFDGDPPMHTIWDGKTPSPCDRCSGRGWIVKPSSTLPYEVEPVSIDYEALADFLTGKLFGLRTRDGAMRGAHAAMHAALGIGDDDE